MQDLPQHAIDDPFRLSLCCRDILFLPNQHDAKLCHWRAVSAYLDHYHKERNHQGLDNQVIEPRDEVGREEGDVQCRERLGGLLRYYYRGAA